MKSRLSPVRALEVALALAYGAVVGTWLPVAGAAPIYALAPVVVTSPLPAEPEPHPVAREPLASPASWSPAGPAAARLEVLAVLGSGGGGAAWEADTIPGAPRVVVAPLPGSRAAVWEPVSRIAVGAAGSFRRVAGCPAIVVEGEAVPPGCRAAPTRRASACPSPGERPRGGVVCIRAED